MALVTRLVTVQLSEFACSAVSGDGNARDEGVPARVVAATRCYLNDKDSGGVGWSYPGFLPEAEGGEEVALRLAIADELWRRLEQEAERQGISPQQMITHAVLYVAAEVDAGRVTRRILDDLKKTG